MDHPLPLHKRFVDLLKRAWIERDLSIVDGMVADDVVTSLRPGTEPFRDKKAVMHRVGNLWVVQQNIWTDWTVVSDSASTCRMVGRAGYTNAAYGSSVTFEGTTTVTFKDGLVSLVEVDVRAIAGEGIEAG
ncbi:hypothetical protein BMS3Bbin02_01153 [bacterium BMS3Bbin02]|nr:hypothetical protein BMS3Bbin02_01153 [bacterium BMS3Bbin02]